MATENVGWLSRWKFFCCHCLVRLSIFKCLRSKSPFCDGLLIYQESENGFSHDPDMLPADIFPMVILFAYDWDS